MTDELNPIAELEELVERWDHDLTPSVLPPHNRESHHPTRCHKCQLTALLPELRTMVQAEREACGRIYHSNAHPDEEGEDTWLICEDINCIAIRSRGSSDGRRK